MIAATVLAAGESRRMGEPKALLDWHGESFLTVILGKLRLLGVNTGYVVVGGDRDKILQSCDLGVFVAIDTREPDAGPIGSIRSAIRKVGPEISGLLVWPVDLPHVQIETVRAVLEAKTDRPIVAPEWGGRRGHPMVLKREIFQEILQLKPGLTARDVVRSNPRLVRRVGVSDPAVIASINTPADYRRWREAE